MVLVALQQAGIFPVHGRARTGYRGQHSRHSFFDVCLRAPYRVQLTPTFSPYVCVQCVNHLLHDHHAVRAADCLSHTQCFSRHYSDRHA